MKEITPDSNEQCPKGEQDDQLSPEMRRLLEEEAAEAEIETAIDAALEEGIIISREEAIEILFRKQSKPTESEPPN